MPGKLADIPENLRKLFKQFKETLEGDSVVKTVKPESVENIVNTSFWSSIFSLKLSACANFAGFRMLTLEVMTVGDPCEVISFSTNSNYSWMITKDGAVLTKEGTYDVPDTSNEREANKWKGPEDWYGSHPDGRSRTPLEQSLWESDQPKGRSRRILDMNQALESQTQSGGNEAVEGGDAGKEFTRRMEDGEVSREEVPKVVPWSREDPIAL
ncbi:hypothetical protein HGRIS_008515 [Hohenbuehelia grisea]|uniref:Uncharacterized protein n=1 Tax=Hohenbuehelia grisea TaxID=104357 RepID=A0ABR3J881_9AGAR